MVLVPNTVVKEAGVAVATVSRESNSSCGTAPRIKISDYWLLFAVFSEETIIYAPRKNC
jgi:hypothetical protein